MTKVQVSVRQERCLSDKVGHVAVGHRDMYVLYGTENSMYRTKENVYLYFT